MSEQHNSNTIDRYRYRYPDRYDLSIDAAGRGILGRIGTFSVARCIVAARARGKPTLPIDPARTREKREGIAGPWGG
jgi:hypothetical protein